LPSEARKFIPLPVVLRMTGADGMAASAAASKYRRRVTMDALRKEEDPLDVDKLLGLRWKDLNLVQQIASGCGATIEE
jgi:hypothetical protein